MARAEREPVGEESFLEKVGNSVLKILGIGFLIGLTATALKIVIPRLGEVIDEVKKFIKKEAT